MDKHLDSVTIGTLASTVGIGVETIRFYQRKGLLQVPTRSYGRIRRYGITELRRVRFIKSAQRLGFRLSEIAELLELEDGTSCLEARKQAEQKLTDVRAKLADLLRIETVLNELIGRCAANQGKVTCPLIASLQSDE